MKFLVSVIMLLTMTACNMSSDHSTEATGTPPAAPKDQPPAQAPAPSAQTCKDVYAACGGDAEKSQSGDSWYQKCSAAVDSAMAHGADLNSDCVVAPSGEKSYHLPVVFDTVAASMGVFTNPTTTLYYGDEDAVIKMLRFLVAKGLHSHLDPESLASPTGYFLPVISALSQKNFKIAEYLVTDGGQSLDEWSPWGSHDLCDTLFNAQEPVTPEVMQFFIKHGFDPNLPCLKINSPSKYPSAPLWLALTHYDDAFVEKYVLPRIKDLGDVNAPLLYYNEQPGTLGEYIGKRDGLLGLGWDYGKNMFDTLPIYITINHLSLAGTRYLFQHGAKLTSDMNYPIQLALRNYIGPDSKQDEFDKVVQLLVDNGFNLSKYALETDVGPRCFIVAGFLNAGIILDQEPYDSSYLHECIYNLDALKALVAHGAKLNVPVHHYWEKNYFELDTAACSLKEPARAQTLAFLKSAGSVHSQVDDNCNKVTH